MKRLIIFKGKSPYYGLFYGLYGERTLYETPLINQLAIFFKNKIYQNFVLVQSKDLRRLELGIGVIMGELDGLLLCRPENIIITIEIKNRNIGKFDKKIKLTRKILRYVIKWIYQKTGRFNFKYHLPIWYFRENISDKIREFLANKHVLALEFKKIHQYVLNRANNSRIYLLNNHKLVIEKIKSEIPENSSIHPFIGEKLSEDCLHPIEEIMPLPEWNKLIMNV